MCEGSERGRRPTAPAVLLAALLLLVHATAACAQGGASDDFLDELEPPAANDPLEPFNRRVFAFNGFINRYALEPAFRSYERVVPETGRVAIHNIIDNLRQPVSFVGSAVAGDLEASGFYLRRFAINSTFGLLGALDVAGEVGLPPRNAFTSSDVFCAYGLPAGPFVVMPLFGPGNLRSVAGRILDYSLTYPALGEWYLPYTGAVTFNQINRARGAQAGDGTAFLDPYAAVRSIFEQYDAACGNPR